MELCSFWVINPAEGQDGKPEPVKLVFFENGDVDVISISVDWNYRGAYKLPAGSYAYSGETLKVSGDNLGEIISLTSSMEIEEEYRAELLDKQLLNVREWDLFFANPVAWKSLRIVVITFGDE